MVRKHSLLNYRTYASRKCRDGVMRCDVAGFFENSLRIVFELNIPKKETPFFSLRIEQSGFEPWPGTKCCGLGFESRSGLNFFQALI